MQFGMLRNKSGAPTTCSSRLQILAPPCLPISQSSLFRTHEAEIHLAPNSALDPKLSTIGFFLPDG
jgi:hypothetical protein